MTAPIRLALLWLFTFTAVFLGLSVLWHLGVANAATGTDVAGGQNAPLADLQQALTATLTAVAIGVLGWIGHRAAGLLSGTKAGKAVETAAHQLGIDSTLADAARAYAEEQAKKLGLAGASKMKEAESFLKAHGYAGEALAKMLTLVEAKVNAQRAMDAATAQLAKNAAALQASLAPGGELATKIAKLPGGAPPVPAHGLLGAE